MSDDLSKLAVHTMTHKPWSLAQCCESFVAAGVAGMSVWRNVIEPIGVGEAEKIVKASGLAVPALVRGGFFPACDSAARQAAIDDCRTCIDEAAALGAEMVVLVVGAVPGMALEEARKQVADGIAVVLHHAQTSGASGGIKLAIEPLHPMYAADKSCFNRMAEAREICEQLSHPLLGIAVDVYHVWWDPDLEREINSAGKSNRLFGFHLCDWRVDTRHLLTDRGLMGEGCINLSQIRRWIERAGFNGFDEVEVFSESYWAQDQHDYLALIKERYQAI